MKYLFMPLLALALLTFFTGPLAAQRVSKTDKEVSKTEKKAEGPAPGQPGNSGVRIEIYLEQAKGEDGKVEISKAVELAKTDLAKKIAAADTDKDNLLTQDEVRTILFPAPPDPFAAAKTDDGRIDLSKLPERMPEEMVNRLKEADADSDGFLSSDEQKSLPFMAGGPGPMRDPFAAARTEDGRIDLSKLSERMPEEFRSRLIDADSDGDGFLNEEEQGNLFSMNPPGRPQGSEDNPVPRGRNRNNRTSLSRRPNDPAGPGFPGDSMNGIFEALRSARTKDGKTDAAKLLEGVSEAQQKQLKNADTDKDGFLSEEEVKALIPPRSPRPERPDDRSNARTRRSRNR